MLPTWDIKWSHSTFPSSEACGKRVSGSTTLGRRRRRRGCREAPWKSMFSVLLAAGRAGRTGAAFGGGIFLRGLLTVSDTRLLNFEPSRCCPERTFDFYKVAPTAVGTHMHPGTMLGPGKAAMRPVLGQGPPDSPGSCEPGAGCSVSACQPPPGAGCQAGGFLVLMPILSDCRGVICRLTALM